MAFVYLSQKTNSFLNSQINSNTGPGTYNIRNGYSIKKSYAGFGSTEERQKNIKEQQITPGPGQYQTDITQLNNLKELQNEKVKSLQIKKPSQYFNCTSKRFEENSIKQKELIPGPGFYDFDINYLQQNKIQENNKQSQKIDIIDHLMKLNRYQVAPSIPSKANTYGYSENENGELSLNKLPMHLYNGDQIDSVGPGYYNPDDTMLRHNQQGTQWHKYQSRTIGILRDSANNNIGPGSYNAQVKQIPLYKLKQSPAFANKQAKSLTKQKSVQSLKTQSSLKYEKENKENSEEINPGPGHYFNQEYKIQTKAQKFQNFGSFTPSRFNQNEIFQNRVGPGQYNPVIKGLFEVKQPLQVQKIKQPPFLSSNSRFELSDKIIENLQKGYKGNFGTKDKRFKNKIEEIPGPGSYIEPFKEQIQQNAQSAVFKSNLDRQIIFQNPKEQKPPIGAYKLDYYDIQHKLLNIQNVDPEIKPIIPNLGFGCQEIRFKQNNIIDEIYEEEDEQQNYKSIDQKTKNKKERNTLPQAQRFNNKKEPEGPAPGDYNNNGLSWNKRTYNVHFAAF
ncbi:hypothetical protein IMG5_102030 [Ichthyophthirius multifiliis]|uniref:Uncharacterized protein n=1 Tax=Ichthyophthirius multifiliis TaxID=5932 RepID=G0QSL4_ICHMU|nr:hypothetical protein IMG5_102030 [Ichthyophthirius multifiliis]EGR31794.1 hypothetical protein IMG5_102030 [Ichthyophthirius multifiliis]|eukprot:XP_004035280.1 hypothetical protein IMG5_102030 [Ichthyophthirius multifiliis]